MPIITQNTNQDFLLGFARYSTNVTPYYVTDFVPTGTLTTDDYFYIVPKNWNLALSIDDYGNEISSFKIMININGARRTLTVNKGASNEISYIYNIKDADITTFKEITDASTITWRILSYNETFSKWTDSETILYSVTPSTYEIKGISMINRLGTYFRPYCYIKGNFNKPTITLTSSILGYTDKEIPTRGDTPETFNYAFINAGTKTGTTNDTYYFKVAGSEPTPEPKTVTIENALTNATSTNRATEITDLTNDYTTVISATDGYYLTSILLTYQSSDGTTLKNDTILTNTDTGITTYNLTISSDELALENLSKIAISASAEKIPDTPPAPTEHTFKLSGSLIGVIPTPSLGTVSANLTDTELKTTLTLQNGYTTDGAPTQASYRIEYKQSNNLIVNVTGTSNLTSWSNNQASFTVPYTDSNTERNDHTLEYIREIEITYTAPSYEIPTSNTFANIYTPTPEELNTLATDRIITSSNSSFDYGQYITNLYYLPFTLDITNPPTWLNATKTAIQLGDHTSKASSYLVNTNEISYSLGSVTLPEVTNPSDFENKSATLFSPFTNTPIELPVLSIAGKTLECVATLEAYSGTGYLRIVSSDEIILTTQAQLTIGIPFYQFNPSGIYAYNPPQYNGIGSTFIQYKSYDNLLNYNGFDDFTEVEIGTDKGYNRYSEVDLTINPLSQNIKDEIVNQLSQGIIIN